jgi:hypothetical protein
MLLESSAVRCENIISHIGVISMSAVYTLQLQAWKGKHELRLGIPRSVKRFAVAFSLVTVFFFLNH